MSSSKRARGASNGGNQPVCCLVDGCNSDLSNCRDYHRRHKVCELHSKTPQVSICGLKQRFCQQCSRFHSLEEFDEGKRSCRKRLDGHNRRRRKPQSDLLPRFGGSFSCHQGPHLFPFTSSQVFQSTTVSSHGWSSAVSDGAGHTAAIHSRNQQNFLEKQSIFVEPSNHSSSNNYKAAQPLAFLHDGGGGGGGEINKMIYERFRIGVSESDCALSLLSSPQTHLAGAGAAAESGGCSGHLDLSRIEQQRNAAVSVLQPLSHHHNDNHGVNFAGIFGIASDNAGNESPSTLPFHWE